jgi:hypothetical protein
MIDENKIILNNYSFSFYIHATQVSIFSDGQPLSDKQYNSFAAITINKFIKAKNYV